MLSPLLPVGETSGQIGRDNREQVGRLGVGLGQDTMQPLNQDNTTRLVKEVPSSRQPEASGDPLADEFKQVPDKFPEVFDELPGEWVTAPWNNVYQQSQARHYSTISKPAERLMNN